MVNNKDALPAEFAAATKQLGSVKLRSELNYREIPTPTHAVKHAYALGAALKTKNSDAHEDHDFLDNSAGSGRLILLYDPEMAHNWGNHFRFVCYAHANIEPEMGEDPLLLDVSWSWLIDSLQLFGADFTAVAGTATKTLSTGYGALAGDQNGSQVQLRASWTPGDYNIAAHAKAWGQLICLLGGLSFDEGIPTISSHSRGNHSKASKLKPV